MTCKLISIIMPAYNAQEFIAEAVHSVCNQTYSNWELLIIDDGSTDDTSKIVQNYAAAEKRIRVITQKNQGVSAARNKGLNIASGEYITFLDSDDKYYPDYLRRLYERATETSADVIYCGCYHEKINQNIPAQFVEGDVLFKGYVKNKSSIGIFTILIKRNFIEENNLLFDISASVGEDQMFMVQALSLTQAYAVDEVLYHHRWNKKSAINTMGVVEHATRIASIQKMETLVQEFYSSPNKRKVVEHFKKEAMQHIVDFIPLLKDAFMRKKYAEVKKCINLIGGIPAVASMSNLSKVILNLKLTPLWIIYRKLIKMRNTVS